MYMSLILCKYEDSVARLTNDIITKSVFEYKCRQRRKYRYKFTFAKQSTYSISHIDQLNIFPLDITKLINKYTIGKTISVNLMSTRFHTQNRLCFFIKIYIDPISYDFTVYILMSDYTDICIYNVNTKFNTVPYNQFFPRFLNFDKNKHKLLDQSDENISILEDIHNVFKIIINYITTALKQNT